MERGSNELSGNFRLHDTALFYDTGWSYDSSHTSKPDARLDEQSRTNDSEHHGDDELECVIGSNVVWDRCPRHGHERLGCRHDNDIYKLHG